MATRLSYEVCSASQTVQPYSSSCSTSMYRAPAACAAGMMEGKFTMAMWRATRSLPDDLR